MNTTEKKNNKPFLILASESARRRYLLKQAGINFSVIPSNFDENSIPVSAPGNYVTILAESKAKYISDKYPDSWVIGADTVVVINGKILGKPSSRDDARIMLKDLSGQTHEVITGYCICCKAKERSFSESIITKVLFKDLSEDEIEWYIHTKEPFDKAGGYAIQGLGTFLVKSISGSYTNVVGLPVCEVIEFLIKERIIGFDSIKRINNY
ncbi:MAG: septum formation inhibitor Maf [Desulfobacterium sp.]|nr:septum formation inhibitor Maf [Desulfobacterium sp.]MBU3947222.1 septum formation inhibitor Maf [Pseudomonadota bacterium]MBU4010404.1 septum formation inhibitor Maf [Pseudomonadota bacterium]MBU4037854.1 septum formation inhibitor Maf [Pseudomonadota bacterium]